MTIEQQIKAYISSQPEGKSKDMQMLHDRILKINPKAKLWYEIGVNSEGKTVSNPNIGFGSYTIKYADGKSREFFQVGFSGNTTGISLYIMGLDDKTFLTKTYGSRLGKAKVTSYCIKFKSLKDVDLEVLEEAIRFRFKSAGN